MPDPRLMDQLRDALRSRHYSRRTEQAYSLWVRRFIRFHHMRHPHDMGEREINAFLTDLAVEKRVSASTQTQALSAVLFLYRNVIGRDVGDLGGVVRARKPRRMPVVMTRDEVRAVLAQMDGDTRLMASLMYGTGMRLMECLRLRVLDVDFGASEITVRDGKGAKDRVTVLPEALVPALERQLKRAKAVHERDLADGWGRVVLPDALDRKYPNAASEWRWQFVFPQQKRWIEPADRPAGAPSRPRDDPAARGARGREPRRRHEARGLPHVPALVRDPPAGERLRHPHDPGAARPQGPLHDDDLHPRAQQGRARREEPVRRAVSRKSE